MFITNKYYFGEFPLYISTLLVPWYVIVLFIIHNKGNLFIEINGTYAHV